MALKKETDISKIEVVSKWNIQVRTDTIIKEDDTEITRSFHRHSLIPYFSAKDSDGNWTHTATDISAETATVQAIANAAWTDAVKAAYKVWREA